MEVVWKTGRGNEGMRFLLRAAGSVHSQKVALGHTMNDQAETFLMRLVRGSGSVGLSAMSSGEEMFIRPLLSIQRQEILDYLKLRGIDLARRRFKSGHPVPAEQVETRTHSEVSRTVTIRRLFRNLPPQQTYFAKKAKHCDAGLQRCLTGKPLLKEIASLGAWIA